MGRSALPDSSTIAESMPCSPRRWRRTISLKLRSIRVVWMKWSALVHHDSGSCSLRVRGCAPFVLVERSDPLERVGTAAVQFDLDLDPVHSGTVRGTRRLAPVRR